MRSTVRDAANRAFLLLTRGTLKKAKDDKLMQEVDVDLHFGEKKTKVERFQQYGFTSVPLPEKDEKDPHIAEVLVAFLGGNRSHAVAFMIDDRRHRLKNMKPGEVALYDDQGQRTMITRDAIVHSSTKKVVSEVVDGKSRGEKDYGQDAGEQRTPKTSIIHEKDHITLKFGDKTSVRLDKDGITLKTDKDILSKSEGGVIKAEGTTHNWFGPKEDA
jgi:phage baseplate assembly protein V